MSSFRRCVLVVVSGVVVATALTIPASAQEQTWIGQFGTSAADSVYSVARADADGVVVAGGTAGNIGGTHYGLSDLIIVRYDASGTRVWVRQSGTSAHEWAWSVAPDGAGGVFVAGTTNGNLGSANAGRWDAWLARYDGDGNQLWIRQFGTSGDDDARALAPDGAGGVFVAGDTSGNLGGQNAGNMDIWLARYDASGNRVWLRQIGTNTGDRARGLASDGAGGFFLSGNTHGNFGGQNLGLGDVIIARFDGAGNQTWIRQIGTAAGDYTESAAAPDGAGGVYIAGYTYGNLGGTHRGGEDAWLARYDGAGTQSWIVQFGTAALDIASGVTSDGSGGAVVAGMTYGELAGPNAGGGDVWLASYDAAGSRSWVRQFGSPESENANSISAAGGSGYCLGGETYGNLGGANAGESDAWLA
ncbi:MAG: SBBP repeat-containing protein [Phycisphaeraceae bacterium]|nr:MAG: SBBP repeat-containing protein [Phycisphaeraceae bacterium]